MKLLQFIILSALFTIILNACNANSKEECHRQFSPKQTRKDDFRCCWYEARFRYNKNQEWRAEVDCGSYPYDGGLLSLEIELEEAKIIFDGGEVDYASIDCSSEWIHLFVGLVLLFAFIL